MLGRWTEYTYLTGMIPGDTGDPHDLQLEQTAFHDQAQLAYDRPSTVYSELFLAASIVFTDSLSPRSGYNGILIPQPAPNYTPRGRPGSSLVGSATRCWR